MTDLRFKKGGNAFGSLKDGVKACRQGKRACA